MSYFFITSVDNLKKTIFQGITESKPSTNFNSVVPKEKNINIIPVSIEVTKCEKQKRFHNKETNQLPFFATPIINLCLNSIISANHENRRISAKREVLIPYCFSSVESIFEKH